MDISYISASLFLVIFMCPFLDRLRGDGRVPGSFIKSFLLGICYYCIVAGGADKLALLFAFLFAIGEAPGWGFIGSLLNKTPLTEDPDEWYVIGPLKTNLWAAAIVRGCLWSLPCLLAAYFNPLILIPCFAIPLGFVGAIYIGRNYLSNDPLLVNDFVIAKSRWSKHELVRGFITALIIFILTLFFV